jgi:hypothetical protein
MCSGDYGLQNQGSLTCPPFTRSVWFALFFTILLDLVLKLPLNKKSFEEVELEPILRFVVYAALITPPNYKWQEFLERKWPSRKPIKESSSDLKPSQKKDKGPAKNRLSLTNTGIKFVLDQSLSAPINTVAFIYLMGGMTFQSNSQIWNNVQNVGHSTLHKPAIPLWEG